MYCVSVRSTYSHASGNACCKIKLRFYYIIVYTLAFYNYLVGSSRNPFWTSSTASTQLLPTLRSITTRELEFPEKRAVVTLERLRLVSEIHRKI